ncbi:MAG: hypothetical protein WCC38_18460 [Pseudonocardiaceae bacterium]
MTAGPVTAVALRPPGVEAGRRLPAIATGLFLAVVLAVIATTLGRLAPIVGGPVFGILIVPRRPLRFPRCGRHGGNQAPRWRRSRFCSCPSWCWVPR